MFLTYACLFVLMSSGFSLPRKLPWEDNRMRFSQNGNVYGASRGFKPANIKDHPYLASVLYEPYMMPTGAVAILNKNWVLGTAIFTMVPAEKLRIYVGTNFGARSGQSVNVTKAIAHKNFSSEYDLSYNIAVFKLEKPLTFNDKVKPVKVGNSTPKVGTNCTVLGYGYFQDKPYTGWNLGAVTIKVKPQKDCNRQYGVLKTAFCASAEEVLLCTGDIGDLLMYKDKLVGFYVLGDYCNDSYAMQVFTKVSSFKKWIWKTIKDNSNDDELEGLSEDQFNDD